MFDVAWSEPVETVGERKSRKDQNGKRVSHGSSISSSKSSDASVSPSQTRPSLLGLFNHKKGAHQRSTSTSRPANNGSDTTIKASKCMSTYTFASDSSNQESTGAKAIMRIPPISFSEEDAESSTETDADVFRPSDESMFSGWNGRSSATTDSSWGSNFTRRKGEMVQPLNRNSYITQSTEVTISPRDSVNEDDKIASVVRISSIGTVPIKISTSPSHPDSPPTTSTFDFPIPRFSLLEESSSPTEETESVHTDVVFQPKEPPSDTWRPPEAWQCPLTKVEQAVAPQPKSPLSRMREKKKGSRQSELTHLQHSIRKMNAASPKIILERLKEEWVGIAEASIYRELELEKQLWMLAALKFLHADDVSDDKTHEESTGASPPKSQKVLSLYENKASSSFLSASHPDLEIHHLSTSPLLPKHYPNVRPLSVPGPSAKLPYASNLFASIYSFSLPALLPSSSIPALLKECQRTLIPLPKSVPSTDTSPSSSRAGTLHLTILDPAPLPSTLGPMLRLWLDTHLIVNLERQFRCINPARLFPIWLADAGLRAEGSTISHVRFLASVEESPTIDGVAQEQGAVSAECTKQELKSTTGRMLWKEMWGPFVEGKKWWWEDERIVEECRALGTCWECAIIESVREG